MSEAVGRIDESVGRASRVTVGNPQVSVVIPNYNHTRFLRDAIQSALAQTCPALEIIVVDDGSTDGCKDVVIEFGPRVRYIFQENQGLAAARNTGIRAARGELVGLLDADDQWLPGFLASLCTQVAAAPEASVYYCAAQAVDERGEELPRIFGGPPVAPELLYEKMLRADFLIPSTIVLRRDAAMAAGLFDPAFKEGCEDWEFWLRLLPTHRFVGTGQAQVLYRIHGNSLSADTVRMQRSALAVMEACFGPDDGMVESWTREKRRGYAAAYRYGALISVQRQRNWRGAASCLRRALQLDPTLATDLDLFYDLALGDQPIGYRGTTRDLNLDENVGQLLKVVGDLRVESDASLGHTLQGTALQALGLVSYNAGHYSLSRRLLLRALYYRPALWRERVVRHDLVASFAAKPVLRWIARTRHRQVSRRSSHPALSNDSRSQ